MFSAIISCVILVCAPFDRTSNTFHALTRFYSHIILIVCGVKLVVSGLNRVRFGRSYIYVSNHASYFDIPAVLAGIPAGLHIIYKRELERIPILGWGLKYGKTYIGIDRGGGQDALGSLEKAVSKIKNGASVIMFAEGTRSHDGSLQPFKRGPFKLAVKAGVPIVPVTICGSYDILPRHSLRIRSGTISIVLGEPIEPLQTNGNETELELRDQVYTVISQNLRQG